jgi:hypothetical protein
MEFPNDSAWQSPKGPFREALERRALPPRLRFFASDVPPQPEPAFFMTVRREMPQRRATRVTCEPCPCLSRFPRPSRPARLSQASAIAADTFMNNVS